VSPTCTPHQEESRTTGSGDFNRTHLRVRHVLDTPSCEQGYSLEELVHGERSAAAGRSSSGRRGGGPVAEGEQKEKGRIQAPVPTIFLAGRTAVWGAVERRRRWRTDGWVETRHRTALVVEVRVLRLHSQS
jgi:hypothetical protein